MNSARDGPDEPRRPEMDLDQTAAETRRLQRCINDLVSVLALPALWTGGDAPRVANILTNSLQGMLRLDISYIRLNNVAGEAPIELASVAEADGLNLSSQEIGMMLGDTLGNEPGRWPAHISRPYGDEVISIAVLRLGLRGGSGVLVAGSRRPDFPAQTEALLLSVAANQAAIGLQGARLLSERRHLADEPRSAGFPTDARSRYSRMRNYASRSACSSVFRSPHGRSRRMEPRIL